MTIELTWYGHATWGINVAGHKIIIDPFFDQNPSSPIKASDVDADFLLISHGHFDHIADAAAIANRTGAKVVAMYEIAQWLGNNHSVENTIEMNLGGAVDLPFGKVKMTIAHHSSQLPDGSYGGDPAGFLLTLGTKKLYFACDTALFGDMKLYSGVDVAILPIGDLFTMGPEDSVEATKLINPNTVIPTHFNTWPPIEQDTEKWSEAIRSHTKANPVVLNPGQSIEI